MPAMRLRSAPVAELSGFVASTSNTTSRKSPKKQRPFAYSARRAPIVNSVSKSATTDQHTRVLELLRAALTASPEAEKPAETAGEDKRQKLVELRTAFIGVLRELQMPQADSIMSVSELLQNRSELGLLDLASVSEFCHSELDDSASCIDEDAAPMLPASYSSDDTTLLGTDDELFAERSADSGRPSKTSFIESWAHNGFWRGVSTRSWMSPQERRSRRRTSASSDSTLVAPYAVPDHLGICWPLDDTAREAARSWGRFYADLGDTRVPSRFRTPDNSLAMLATEQLMMRNDKIVCPLKNRLQETNPKRQQFEEYVRATGSLPPPAVSSDFTKSPLRNEL
ncbi:hypothetical protein EC988_005954 [Linderina pennispora]|nr:hypothetical protein EC988_005954 [Linderina pennispora]